MTAGQATPLLRHVRKLAAGGATAMSDAELLECYVERHDDGAFDALMRRHGPMVLGVCRAVLRSDADAEDAFQATFLVLARKAGSIRRREGLGSWLHGVAYRVAQKARAATARRRAVEAKAAPPAAASADDLSWGEVRALLHAELAGLPEHFRGPLVLCYLEELTHEEAARRLGWTQATVKGRLQRGRELLRRRLERRGLGLSAALAAVSLTGQAGAAALPAALAETTLQAVRTVAAGKIVPGTAAALARGVAGPIGQAKLRVAAIALLVAVAGGVAHFSRAPTDAEPAAAAAKPPASPIDRTADRAGDRLPDGAVARLGTGRFNHGDGLNSLHFTPDGKTVISEGQGFIHLWDAGTGNALRRFATGAPPWFQHQTVLTADGKALISLGDWAGDIVRTWDLAEGKEVGAVKLPMQRGVHSSYLLSALSPDGRLVAAQTADLIRVFDAATAAELWRLAREKVDGRGLFFAGNDRLVTVENKKVIQLWEARTGKPIRQTGHDSELELLTVSGDGRWLAGLERRMQPFKLPDGDTRTVHERDVIHVWDLTTAVRKHSLQPERKRWHFRVQFGGDEQLLFVSSFDEQRAEPWGVTVWDVNRGRAVRELAGADGRALAVSPDGKRLVEGDDGKFYLWDLTTGRILADDESRLAQVQTLALSATGDRLFTFGDASVNTWDAASGRRLRSFAVPRYSYSDPGRCHFFSADGRYAASLAEEQGRAQILIWDVATGRRLHTLRPSDKVRYVSAKVQNVTNVFDLPYVTAAFAPDASLLATWHATDETVVRIWEMKSGREVVSFAEKKAGWPAQLLFAPDGKTLFVAGMGVAGYDVPSGNALFSWRMKPTADSSGILMAPVGGPFPKEDDRSAWRNLIVSPDGTMTAGIVSGGGFGGEPLKDRIVLCDSRTGKVLRRWSDSSKSRRWPEQLAFSRDGRLLASTARDVVHVWEVATGKEVRAFRGQRGEFAALAFSADGRRLASAASDSTVVLWDVTLISPERAGAAPGQQQIAAWWADLAADDAGRAQAAIWRLAEAPAASLPLLRQRLRPITESQANEIARHIADLDSNTFTVRSKAFEQLRNLGLAAAPALRQSLKQNAPLETRRRVEQLLERLTDRPPEGEALRTLRALAVLEHARTPEARRLLEALAAGAPVAWLTLEAQAVCARLVPRKTP